MWAAIEQFIISHQPLILGVSIASVVLFLTSLVLIPFAVLRIPEDYFIKKKTPAGDPPSDGTRRPHLAWRILWLVVRNILGIFFLILGVILLVLPGPGWLTILVGIALLDFPLKHKLEMKVVSLPVVRDAVNSYRVKKNKPPILFPGTEFPGRSHKRIRECAGHREDTEGEKEKKE